ncbi:hypothetical protein M441DRAFT_145523 [Trichoderma asperellum CBS 433.97]|uniref:DUF1365-domain-containing protein n=1 Tax=Trichoderma asperellum (strain ATCC 204424 / CBS 433.97 / NBRC 101777) TaxID=1042311 RepID=A0A2T3Z2F9_TRIA4|nr:hypothetical protein M441DRAFT_145523 [Trichoderma asperellum CBS 433.97]PTB38987.1 hypothetical protein M441DRAFT_145523 [Trichoderma asperellum CBS 433.97]
MCATWNLRSLLLPICHNLARSKYILGTTVLAFAIWAGYYGLGIILRDVSQHQDDPTGIYLIPSRVTHRRKRPKKHSFSYSYLTVGIPVGYRGSVDGMISVDEPDIPIAWPSGIWRMNNWFRVDARDYLERSSHELGLRGKLDNYLESQGANPASYPSAFLVTAPKFLGYQFNPVSFWYLYSPDKILSAIVLEVNNTFGERRPYLVLRDTSEDATRISAPGTIHSNPSDTQIKASWKKDFHVSPFNSRNGSYSLLAKDPFENSMRNFCGVDITINLTSSQGQSKLFAQLRSEGEAIIASQMSLLERIKFIFSWFWVGFLTFPRIVKEAGSLFFSHQLHVWYRPEPLKDSLGRLANGNERRLEPIFRQYLRFLVEKSPNPLMVTYVPSGILESGEETFISSKASCQSEQAQHLKIRILTPVFYSRFVHFAHDFEAIFGEMAENHTIWVDKPEILPKLFLKQQSPPLQVSSFVDFMYFKLIQKLRRCPARIVRPMTSADIAKPTISAEDVRSFRISPMDAFVLGHSSKETRGSYRSLLVRIFVADWLFLGMTEIVYTLELIGRFGVAWWLASFFSAPKDLTTRT